MSARPRARSTATSKISPAAWLKALMRPSSPTMMTPTGSAAMTASSVSGAGEVSPGADDGSGVLGLSTGRGTNVAASTAAKPPARASNKKRAGSASVPARKAHRISPTATPAMMSRWSILKAWTLLSEQVTAAAHGDDVLRVFGVVFYLLAQPADVDVDGLLIAIEVEAPDLVEQRLAR